MQDFLRVIIINIIIITFFCLFVLFFKKLSGEAHFLFLVASDWLLVVFVVHNRISVPTRDVNLWRLVIKDGRGFSGGLICLAKLLFL